MAMPGPSRTQPKTDADVLGVGDIVTVDFSEDFTDGWLGEPRRIRGNGTLAIPLIGPVRVAGLTAAAAGHKILDSFSHGLVDVCVHRLWLAGEGGFTPGPIRNYDLVRCSLTDLPPADSGSAAKPGRVVVGRVDGRCRITMPKIGPVWIAGMDEDQAGRAIGAAYVAAGGSAVPRVSVLILERAPADSGDISLPDGPIEPVPEPARFLYQPR